VSASLRLRVLERPKRYARRVGDRTTSPRFVGALLLLVACESAPPIAPAVVRHEAAPRDAGAAASDATVPRDGEIIIKDSDECGFLLDQVYFEHDSATLRDVQRPIIDETAGMFRCFRRTGEVTKWQVIGNTDATERDPAKLSLARARAVAVALVARGVVATTLDVTGIGATQPMDRRGTPAARAKNRRVFFLVLNGRGSPP
jgi:outer membrane protein OmpA-like peptidoglycan-associated protein